MITEGPRINLTLPDASVKESDSHVAESCRMRQTNRRENYVYARGDSAAAAAAEGRAGGRARDGGGGRRTGNVFKFMAAFKTPSASGHGLRRATGREGRARGAARRKGDTRGKQGVGRPEREGDSA